MTTTTILYDYGMQRDILLFTQSAPEAALGVKVNATGVTTDSSGTLRILAGQALQQPEGDRQAVASLVVGPPEAGNTIIGVTQHDIVFYDATDIQNANCIIYGFIDPLKMDYTVRAIPAEVRSALAGKVWFIDGNVVSAANVYTYADLVNALADPSIKSITLMASFHIVDTITIDRQLTLNGNGNTLTYSEDEFKDGIVVAADNVKIMNLVIHMTNDDPLWEGHYGIQVYDSVGVVLEDIASTGEDGGFLINGSIVEMYGEINVSANEFGGIEVSTGSTLTRESTLVITGASIVNKSEAPNNPTIWIDGQGVVIGANHMYQVPVDQKTYFFIDFANSGITPNATLSSLAIAGIGLQPTFDPATFEYISATVSPSHAVTFTAAEPDATVVARFNTLQFQSGDVIQLGSGLNNIRIQVTHYTQTEIYLVSIFYTPPSVQLQDFQITSEEPVTITPSPNPSVFYYTGTATVSEFSIQAQAESPTAIIRPTLNGTPITFGSTQNWVLGANSLILAISNGLLTQDYVLSVIYSPN